MKMRVCSCGILKVLISIFLINNCNCSVQVRRYLHPWLNSLPKYLVPTILWHMQTFSLSVSEARISAGFPTLSHRQMNKVRESPLPTFSIKYQTVLNKFYMRGWPRILGEIQNTLCLLTSKWRQTPVPNCRGSYRNLWGPNTLVNREKWYWLTKITPQHTSPWH